MSTKFYGYYYKHQKDGKTVAIIPGISESGAFIQIITEKKSLWYPLDNIIITDEEITADGCSFSKRGVDISLPLIEGKVLYSRLTPLRSDIMGIFKYFPMECRHGIVSMRHKLLGSIKVENTLYDFDGGVGYIEKDSGVSFPKSYFWINCNNFCTELSITAAVAEIPFAGLHFKGSICAVIYKGREYRLATYLGVKISTEKNTIIFRQRRLKLIIKIFDKGENFSLLSPVDGKMKGTVYESNCAAAEFILYDGERLIFREMSSCASLELFNTDFL